MDCHRILISNGLDHFVLPGCRWTDLSASFVPFLNLRRRVRGVFPSFLFLRSFTANAALHSHSLLSFAGRRFHDHSFLQHSTVRAIQRHLLGQSANSSPSRSYGRTVCLVNCTNFNPPSRPTVGLEDEYRNRHHLSALSGRDNLYSLSRRCSRPERGPYIRHHQDPTV